MVQVLFQTWKIQLLLWWDTARIWELPLSSLCPSLCFSFICLSQFMHCLEQISAFGKRISALHTGLKDGIWNLLGGFATQMQ